MLTDAHLHLQKIKSPEAFLKQAKKNGFGCFLSAATDLSDWQSCLDLSQKHKDVIPFIGTHPWYSDRHNQHLLASFLENNPFAQVGEIGLDGLQKTINQESVFTDQLLLAKRLNRLCVIHCVKEYAKLCQILNEYPSPDRFLIHCFRGGLQEMIFLVKKGAYFTFPTALKGNQLDVFKKTPLEKILIESDADGKKEQNMTQNIDYFSVLKGISTSEFKRILEQNAAKYLEGMNG